MEGNVTISLKDFNKLKEYEKKMKDFKDLEEYKDQIDALKDQLDAHKVCINHLNKQLKRIVNSKTIVLDGNVFASHNYGHSKYIDLTTPSLEEYLNKTLFFNNCLLTSVEEEEKYFKKYFANKSIWEILKIKKRLEEESK